MQDAGGRMQDAGGRMAVGLSHGEAALWVVGFTHSLTHSLADSLIR